MTIGNCSFHSALRLLCTSIMYKGKSLKIAVVHLENKYFSHGPLHVPFSRGGNNSIEEEITERISLWNKAFHANQDLFKSKLLMEKSKLRMYQTLVRPVVTYACETWVLKKNTKTKLRVFERKVLRRIYGPTKESDGTWRIKSNEELNRLIGNKNIISKLHY